MQQEILPTEQPKKYNIFSGDQKNKILNRWNTFALTQKGFQGLEKTNLRQIDNFLANDVIVLYGSHLPNPNPKKIKRQIKTWKAKDPALADCNGNALIPTSKIEEFNSELLKIIPTLYNREFQSFRAKVLPIVEKIRKDCQKNYNDKMFSEGFWIGHKKKYDAIKNAWEGVPYGGGKECLKKFREQEVVNSPSTNASENANLNDIDDNGENQMELEVVEELFDEETQDQEGFKKFDKEFFSKINWYRFEKMDEYFSIEEIEDCFKNTQKLKKKKNFNKSS